MWSIYGSCISSRNDGLGYILHVLVDGTLGALGRAPGSLVWGLCMCHTLGSKYVNNTNFGASKLLPTLGYLDPQGDKYLDPSGKGWSQRVQIHRGVWILGNTSLATRHTYTHLSIQIRKHTTTRTASHPSEGS